MSMTKTEIIAVVAEALGDRKQAQAAVESLLNNITQALKQGETVTLSGFGTFKRVERKARQGVNPRTGAKIKIKARRAARFTPGTKLQAAVN
jgi:nucleoid DNA-binding protein